MARPKKYTIDTKQLQKLAKFGLRQLQWKSAEKGNVTMQIFLGKNILGQKDRIEESETEEPLQWSYD